MDIFGQIIGFFIGVLSSWAFWYLMILVKPKILVSQSAVYNPNTNSFLVKVRNESRRQATDIQVSLSVLERKDDGRLLTLHKANLRKDSLFALAPIQDLHKSWELQSTHVFVSDDGKEIMGLLSDKSKSERRAVFIISAADGTSGTKVVQQVTFRLEDVKIGRFGLGFNIEASHPESDEQEIAERDE